MEDRYPNLRQVPEPTMIMQFVAFAERPFTVRGWVILEETTRGFPSVVLVPTEKELFSMLDRDRIDIALYARRTGYAAFATAMALYLLFRHQIGLHLERLSSHLQQEQEERLVEPFELRRRKEYPDELRLLVDAINSMRLKLHDDIRKRETLMAEVHHRIKNDMTFVGSLLLLQASQSDLPAVKDALGQASRRVSVMTRVYERLYLNDDFHRVEVRPLAEQVIADLLELGRISSETVRLSAEEFFVSTKASVAIGIILNELLTNALKHARTGPDTLSVQVELKRKEGDAAVKLRISDNGDGFPGEVLSGSHRGYGLTVVEAMVEQHNGTITFTNSPGASVIVQIATE